MSFLPHEKASDYGGPQPPTSGCALCIGTWHWGECSLPCAFVLGIHPNLSLAFAFTIGIHLKAGTRLISNLHIKNVSLPQAIVFNHHKFMVYSVDPPQPEVCHSRLAMMVCHSRFAMMVGHSMFAIMICHSRFAMMVGHSRIAQNLKQTLNLAGVVHHNS